jgi:hypothetical protein
MTSPIDQASDTNLSGSTAAGAQPFFKKRGFLVGIGIVVIIGAAVVSDLPQHPSLAAQISSDTAAVKQINTDAAACAYAVGEAFAIRGDQLGHRLSASDRGRVPALLQQDQVACSFTSQPINDLATIELPGSSAGKSLEKIVSNVTFWTSSDANATIVDITELFDTPSAAKPLKDLRYRERLLAQDRAAAIRAQQSAEHTLNAKLPSVALPILPTASSAVSN